MKTQKLLIISILTTILFFSCKKKPESNNTNSNTPQSQTEQQILSDLSSNVVVATYSDLKLQSSTLYNDIVTLSNDTTAANLSTCRQDWKNTRQSWEGSEGFLFGPVETDNIDPRIDTWPISFTGIDSLLQSGDVFTTTFIDSLPDALKGFHPIEYLLWGQNGNKTISSFTTREYDLLKALSSNLKELTTSLYNSWDPNISGNFYTQLKDAGNGSATYTTKKAAFVELINAMSGICEEVGNSKLQTPFTNHDPSLAESPFSKNSITDFINNIKSAEKIYTGDYTVQGEGIQDFVRLNNLSLDGNIIGKFNAAIASLQNISVSFGDAITQQPNQIQNAITAMNDLKNEIDNNLMPYIQQNITD